MPVRQKRNRDAGFTLTELVLVLLLMSTVLTLGIGFFRTAAATLQGDANLRILEWQLKLAREFAINQRRAVEVRFTAPNLISVVRHDIPSGETILSTAALENHTQFLLFTGQADTPDGFGRATAIDFGAATAVMFTADGMFVDETGNPINGSVFLGQPARPMTSRALTVFGPTARIRVYRWNGTQWRH
ncbi:MAG: prepilin-type N-terminal cleavage/methylation domain-containing protein [Vicinamibacterales bacterium]